MAIVIPLILLAIHLPIPVIADPRMLSPGTNSLRRAVILGAHRKIIGADVIQETKLILDSQTIYSSSVHMFGDFVYAP